MPLTIPCEHCNGTGAIARRVSLFVPATRESLATSEGPRASRSPTLEEILDADRRARLEVGPR